MRLEPLRPEDIDRLAPLWLSLHAHHQRVAPQLAPFVSDDLSWASRKRQYADVMAGNWFGFIACNGEEDVGYLLCAERPMQWNATFAVPPTLWELVTVFVRGDRRGQGIGSKLLAAMDERILSAEPRTRLIGAIPDNRAAIALYRARGYLPTWLMLTRFRRPAPPSEPTSPIAVEPLCPDQVEALQSLWLSLHHHHQAVSPQLGPFVTDDVSWPVIRGLLAESAEEGLLLGAVERGRILGLASAAIYDIRTLPSYSDTWVTEEQVGEIKFLVVAPEARGRGIGAALTAAIDRKLAAQNVTDQFVGAIAPNEGAIRFYQSRGFRPAWLELTQF
jgi:ribosomal protein S18 acetylase RimI-like enzyme